MSSSSTAVPAAAARRAVPARALLAAIGLGSLASLAVALVAQHAYDIQPCPWCVIQRIVVIAIGVVALAGALAAGRAPRAAAWAAGLPLAALSVAGIVAAVYQHEVAAKQFSCAFTWADRTLMSLELDAWAPWLFRVGATCADAAQAKLLGQPFEIWSGAWFALTGTAALAAIALASRRGRRASRTAPPSPATSP